MGRQPDLDEIAPNSFIIHNAKLVQWIKGEGVVVGNHFELVGWRREGLFARLEMRGFNVRSIESRIARLPVPPDPPDLGDPLPREVHNAKERYAFFDTQHLAWQDVPRADERHVKLRPGWAIRRRKGRGASDFFEVFAERGFKAGLHPRSETDALLVGYAPIAAGEPRPLALTAVEGGFTLPHDLVLPPPYRDLLHILGGKHHIITPEGLPHLQHALEQLGLAVEPPQE